VFITHSLYTTNLGIIFLQYSSYFKFLAHLSVSSPASIPLFGTDGLISCSVAQNFKHVIYVQIEIKPYSTCQTGSFSNRVSGA